MIRIFSLLLVAILIGSVPVHAETRIALVIGNGDYETRGWDLRNPTNDADLIARSLSKVGFQVHTIKNATRTQMEKAFKAHGDRLAEAGPNSVGFVYFAGHGVQEDGLNFLIPVDARMESRADVYSEAPRLGDVFRHLERAGNGINFVVLDACRNSNLQATVRSPAGGLAKEARTRGIFISYATEPGQVAIDGVGHNSPYSRALADLITLPGVSAEKMFKLVATRVSQETREKQVPWRENGLLGEDDFCFAGCSASDGTRASASLGTIVLENGSATRDTTTLSVDDDTETIRKLFRDTFAFALPAAGEVKTIQVDGRFESKVFQQDTTCEYDYTYDQKTKTLKPNRRSLKGDQTVNCPPADGSLLIAKWPITIGDLNEEIPKWTIIERTDTHILARTLVASGMGAGLTGLPDDSLEVELLFSTAEPFVEQATVRTTKPIPQNNIPDTLLFDLVWETNFRVVDRNGRTFPLATRSVSNLSLAEPKGMANEVTIRIEETVRD